MSDERRGKISRRAFITTGVAGSLLVPVFLDDLGAAFAQTGGKPVLTIASLNELFRRIHAGGAAQAVPFYREAQANLEGFLLRHFTINPRQLALLRETLGLRGAGIRGFVEHGLQALQSNKPVLAPVASFDPKLDPLVRIRGFGEEIGACQNVRLGALKASPLGTAPTADCEGGRPVIRGRALVNDCQFVMDCGNFGALTDVRPPTRCG